jgi:hypothetical protein
MHTHPCGHAGTEARQTQTEAQTEQADADRVTRCRTLVAPDSQQQRAGTFEYSAFAANICTLSLADPRSAGNTGHEPWRHSGATVTERRCTAAAARADTHPRLLESKDLLHKLVLVQRLPSTHTHARVDDPFVALMARPARTTPSKMSTRARSSSAAALAVSAASASPTATPQPRVGRVRAGKQPRTHGASLRLRRERERERECERDDAHKTSLHCYGTLF